MRAGFAQMLFTAASMISALNAVVLGVGLVLLGRLTGAVGLPVAVTAAAIVGAAAFAAQLVWQRREFTVGLEAG